MQNIMQTPFDWRLMQRQGFFTTRLVKEVMKEMTEAVKAVRYSQIESEAHPNNDSDKGYTNRAVSQFSYDRARPSDSLCNYADLVNHYCSDYLKLFNHQMPPQGKYLFTQRTGPGYYMDAHDDLSDACYLSVLVYLGDPWGSEDGGELVMSAVRRGGQGEVVHAREIAEIAPEPGRVVVFNNKDPFLQHAVRVSHAKARYMIYLGLGTDELMSDPNLSRPY